MKLRKNLLYLLMLFTSICLTSVSTTIYAFSASPVYSDVYSEVDVTLTYKDRQMSFLLDRKEYFRRFLFGDFVFSRELAHPISAKKAPSLIYFNGSLYAFYPGGNEELYYNKYTYSLDDDMFIMDFRGKEIEDYNGSGIRSNRSPGVAVYDGILHVVYKADDNESIYSVTWDGVSEKFMNEQKFHGPLTAHGPALIAYDDMLYLLHVGKKSDSVYQITYLRDRGWSNSVDVYDGGGSGPALGVIDNTELTDLSPLLYSMGTSDSDHIYLHLKDKTRRVWPRALFSDQKSSDVPCTVFVGLKRYDVHTGQGQGENKHNLFQSVTEYIPGNRVMPGRLVSNAAMPSTELMFPYPSFRSNDSCSLIYIEEYNILVLSYVDDKMFHVHYSEIDAVETL